MKKKPQPQLIIRDLRRNRSIRSGSIHGVIYWKFGSRSFPERDWDDFVSVLMAWWRTELFMKARRRRNFSLTFMDGPLRIKGIHLYKDDFLIKLIRRRKVVDIYHVNLNELIAAFRKAEMIYKVRSRTLRLYTH
ncbi:MAG: hypothetical protein ACAI35_13245 [Candidatus Methylacidiphilales bacterium]|nr:hypothetical protein [Candidatus Methylacidiphilales bacterium]